MPAAVIVATVAEPVASLIPTATNHPNRSGDRFAPLATSEIRLATPASTKVCLNPPPATRRHDQQDAGDGGQRSAH